MADNDVLRAATFALTGTTAETVAFTQPWDGIEIENHDNTNELWAEWGGTAVADAADSIRIAPGQAKRIAQRVGPAEGNLSVVGNGGQVSVRGLKHSEL